MECHQRHVDELLSNNGITKVAEYFANTHLDHVSYQYHPENLAKQPSLPPLQEAWWSLMQTTCNQALSSVVDADQGIKRALQVLALAAQARLVEYCADDAVQAVAG